MTNNRVVIGVFDDYADAAMALEDLKVAGFSSEKISLIGPDADEMRPVTSQVVKGAQNSALGHFTVGGAIAGFLVGLATVAIPGTGALVVAGPLMAAFSGAAVGSYLGIVAGALVHFDIPEYEAQVYEAELTAGKVLIAVHADEQDERFRAEQVMDRNGAIEVDTKAA